MSVKSSEYDIYNSLLNEYLPSSGEGESKGEQLVTAVNKLIYKWYNDGDVFDNTAYLSGWANDLSSYANWIYKYVPSARRVLDTVFDCTNDSEYEDLLWNLAQTTLDAEDIENLNKEPKVGSIYDCEGPYRFVEDEDDYYDEDDEDYDEDDDYWDEDIESSVDINAAEDNEVDVLDDAMSNLKDDFDFILQGLEKLQRSGGEDYNTAVEIARVFSDNIQATIASISERLSDTEL